MKSGDTEMTAKGSELTVVDTLDITLTRLLKSRKAGDYEMTYCLTLKNFENELKQKLGDFVVQAKDATVGSYDFDAGDFMFEDAVNGKKLDVYGTLAAVKAQFLKKTSGEVEAALQETTAKVTVDDLRKDFGMISSFETVSTNTENGNHNMGLALSRVNGTVLNPGDTFSYENIVGDSTNAGGRPFRRRAGADVRRRHLSGFFNDLRRCAARGYDNHAARLPLFTVYVRADRSGRDGELRRDRLPVPQ